MLCTHLMFILYTYCTHGKATIEKSHSEQMLGEGTEVRSPKVFSSAKYLVFMEPS